MVWELLREAVSAARREGASDIHLGSHTGLHFRHRGEVVKLDLDSRQQRLLDQVQNQGTGGLALIKGLLDLIESDAEESGGIHDHLVANLKAFADLLSDGQLPPDIDDMIRLGEHDNWRLNLYATDMQGLGLALRHLPNRIPTLEDLIPGALLSSLGAPLRHAMNRKGGLFLVTGSTGSGKSSTLAALVDHINTTKTRKIVTLEDPVEFWHAPKNSIIHHRQVGVDVESFELGLRGAMRQDPDIILIGELRDLDTITRALTAAETGHLVLATLHSRDFGGTISRLVDVFPSSGQGMVRAQLASNLIGVISQRLEATNMPAAEKFGGRVVVPEVAILQDRPGGVRDPIHEGRFKEIYQNLELIHATQESLFMPASRAEEILAGAKYL